MRRGGAGGLTARLMYAGWVRSSAIRREVPWTKHAGWFRHSLNGDHFCGGGAPTHGGVLAPAQLRPGTSGTWHELGMVVVVGPARTLGSSDGTSEAAPSRTARWSDSRTARGVKMLPENPEGSP